MFVRVINRRPQLLFWLRWFFDERCRRFFYVYLLQCHAQLGKELRRILDWSKSREEDAVKDEEEVEGWWARDFRGSLAVASHNSPWQETRSRWKPKFDQLRLYPGHRLGEGSGKERSQMMGKKTSSVSVFTFLRIYSPGFLPLMALLTALMTALLALAFLSKGRSSSSSPSSLVLLSPELRLRIFLSLIIASASNCLLQLSGALYQAERTVSAISLLALSPVSAGERIARKGSLVADSAPLGAIGAVKGTLWFAALAFEGFLADLSWRPKTKFIGFEEAEEAALAKAWTGFVEAKLETTGTAPGVVAGVLRAEDVSGACIPLRNWPAATAKLFWSAALCLASSLRLAILLRTLRIHL